MPDPTRLVRRHVLALEGYAPIVPHEVLSEQLGLPVEQLVKLDANENPYGLLPEVREALATLTGAHLYPDTECRFLRRALAARTGVPEEQLLVGAGADELITLLFTVLVDPGDVVLSCPPTFGMYAFDAAVANARLVTVPRRADFSVDLEALEAAVARHRPKLLLLASPNNPDGSLLPPTVLDRLLELETVVALDEAYVEFAPPGVSRLGEVPARQNLAVLRTFSKWAGLAGLRIGYGAFPATLLPHLWKVKQPYTVSAAASAAALVSLQHAARLEEVGQRLIAEREHLQEALARVSFLQPCPSQANFILCRVRGRSAAELRQALARRGILIRYFQSAGLEDHVRISVGTPEQTDRLLAALAELE